RPPGLSPQRTVATRTRRRPPYDNPRLGTARQSNCPTRFRLEANWALRGVDDRTAAVAWWLPLSGRPLSIRRHDTQHGLARLRDQRLDAFSARRHRPGRDEISLHWTLHLANLRRFHRRWRHRPAFSVGVRLTVAVRPQLDAAVATAGS